MNAPLRKQAFAGTASKSCRWRGLMPFALSASGFFGIVLLLAGCGGKPPVPAWRQTAVTQQNNFLQFSLRGRDFPADLHYQEALRAIRQSADVPSLATLYLTKAAVERSFGRNPDLVDFFRIADLGAEPGQVAYARMLQNPEGDFVVEDLPKVYQPFLKELRKDGRAPEKVLETVQAIEQPFPQVLAAALYRHSFGDSAEILELTAQTASQQGWTKLLRETWERLREVHQASGNFTEANRLRRLLEILDQPDV
jgi:hypothetical protein